MQPSKFNILFKTMFKIIVILSVIGALVCAVFYFMDAKSIPTEDYIEFTAAESVETIVDDAADPEVESFATEMVEETKSDANATVKVNEVPKYNQLEYTDYYGNVTLNNGKRATIQNSGCGITCLAMVATYLKDDLSMTPDFMAEKFARYNTSDGSAWSLFIDSAEVLGLGEVKQVNDWSQGVEEALRNGQVVISNQRGGTFTNSGHYIVLTGITEDGRVLVNDPNGENWNKLSGFENGFEYTDIAWYSAAYWIYSPKA